MSSNKKTYFAKYCDCCWKPNSRLISIHNSENKDVPLNCCDEIKCRSYVVDTINSIYDSFDVKYGIKKPLLIYSNFTNYIVYPQEEMKDQKILNKIINHQINYEKLIKSGMLDDKWKTNQYKSIVMVIASWIK